MIHNKSIFLQPESIKVNSRNNFPALPRNKQAVKKAGSMCKYNMYVRGKYILCQTIIR